MKIKKGGVNSVTRFSEMEAGDNQIMITTKFQRGQYWGIDVIQLEITRSHNLGRRIFLHRPTGWSLEVFYGNKRLPFLKSEFERIYLHQKNQVSLYQIETEVSILFQRLVVHVSGVRKIRFILIPRADPFLIQEEDNLYRIYGMNLHEFSEGYKWIDGVIDESEFISMPQAWQCLEELKP